MGSAIRPKSLSFFFSIGLCLCAHSTAQGMDFDFYPVCRTRLASILSIRQKAIEVDPRITQEYVRNWLAIEPRWKSYTWIHETGDRIDFKTERYRIVARLGQGREGEVYAVSTPSGLRTLKVFYKNTSLPGMPGDLFANNLREWPARAAEEGLAMPKIDGFDATRKILVYEYLDAIPVSDIKNYAAEIGLSPEKADAISHHSYGVADSNLVYSFTKNKYFLVDPY